MKILLLTVGSRGDVQPFVALGRGLQAAGHEVTLCTSGNFGPFVTEHGLAFAPMTDRFVQFIDGDTARKAMSEADNIVSWLRIAIQLNQQVKPIYRELLEDAWRAAQDCDLLVYHPKVLGGYDIAEKLNIPGVLALPFPAFVPTADYPAVVFPPLPNVLSHTPIARQYNRLSYAIIGPMTMASLGSLRNQFRQDTLGLPKRSFWADDLVQPNGQAVTVLHAYSPHVLPRPTDWAENFAVTGYWFLDRADNWQPPADLVAFLADGPPPVYVGFGSISGRNPAQTTEIVLNALAQSGQRGVLATGWGGLETETVPDTVFKLKAVPHDWLFPQMAAVVHHGGAGTTAAGLRAGVPSLLCPFFGDQPFWGRRVTVLGVGPEPIPQKKLTANNLSRAIYRAVSDLTFRQQAQQLGAQIRAEDGVSAAVRLIERL